MICFSDKSSSPAVLELHDGSRIPLLPNDTENILSLVTKGDVRNGAESVVPVFSPLPPSDDSGSVRELRISKS